MPASTISQILAYGPIVEDAFAAYFANIAAVSNANTQILTSRTRLTAAPFLRTPRISISVTHRANTEQRARTAGGLEFYCQKLFGLELQFAVNRENTSQSLATLEGLGFEACSGFAAALNSNSLPFYQVVTLEESGGASSIEADNDEIISALTWDGSLFIRPEQWPAS